MRYFQDEYFIKDHIQMSYIKTFSAKKMIEPIGSAGRRQPRTRAVNPVCFDWSGIVNLSIIYRRIPEIYRKNGNLLAVKSSDNLPKFFLDLPIRAFLESSDKRPIWSVGRIA
jgi:hypothetical protein